MTKIIITYAFLLVSSFSFSQQLVHSSILHGGITGNGVGGISGSGTINFPVKIPANSTIKKAFLIAARDSLADDITVTLNGNNYVFSDMSIITNEFNAFNGSGLNRPNSSLHLLDITSNIDSSINNYTITVPPQPNFSKGFYSLFYLYIIYENSFLSKINCNLFLNTQDVAPIVNYNLFNLSPITNIKPVCLAVSTNYFCDTIQDGSFVQVNTDTIGLIGGEDLNSNLWTCSATYSNFTHYNDSLFGLDDDTPDSLMSAIDALADIKSYVNNGDTAINIDFIYQTLNNSNGGIYSNPIRTLMLSYSTPCDTFSTSISTVNDTICPWGSTQLQATGGSKYSWFGAFGGLNDTSIANPIANPPQTTTYICTITNDSGCVKTEQVKIWVAPCVGIDDINNTPLIDVYPNPTNGSFTITSNKTIETISINNIVGATVYTQTNIANNQLNLNLNLPNALYFISIKTANGTVVKKLVKQ